MTVTLPFDLCQFNGQPLTIDMSKINWHFFNDQVRNVFVFLRNLDLDYDKLDLDFSKCDYIILEMFLLEYVNTDIFVDVKYLNCIWSQIIEHYLNTTCTKAITLSNYDIYNFCIRNKKTIIDVLTKLYSALTFVSNSFSNKKITSKKQQPHAITNVFNIFHYVRHFEMSLMHDETIDYKHLSCFDDYFIQKILKLCSNQSIYLILSYGKTTSNWQIFKTFVDSVI